MKSLELAPTNHTAVVVSLATQHGKQQQFAEAFRRHLGWSVGLAGIDPDAFGTFTSEIPRTLDRSASTQAERISGCDRCDHREREPAAELADPGQCPRCNP